MIFVYLLQIKRKYETAYRKSIHRQDHKENR